MADGSAPFRRLLMRDVAGVPFEISPVGNSAGVSPLLGTAFDMVQHKLACHRVTENQRVAKKFFFVNHFELEA